jgi:Tol biopolymer transport system component
VRPLRSKSKADALLADKAPVVVFLGHRHYRPGEFRSGQCDAAGSYLRAADSGSPRLSVARSSATFKTSPITSSPSLRMDRGSTTTPDLSCDGKLLAYASDRGTNGDPDLWVQPLSQGARPISLPTNPVDGSEPSFSPNGGRIAFSIAARSRRSLRYSRGRRRGATHRNAKEFSPRFSPDEKWILIVSAAGGAPRQVAANVGWGGEPIWWFLSAIRRVEASTHGRWIWM